MPAFMTFLGNLFTITPPPLTLLSVSYPITVSLFDGAMTTTSTFNVIVINLPPTFVNFPLPDQTIHVGSTLSFTPSINDPEG